MPWSDLPRNEFRERLRTYFLGFGIGLILMGLVLYTRYRVSPPGPGAPQPAQRVDR